MGKAFDAMGSYRTLPIQLAAVPAGAASLMLFLQRYPRNH
jgi:hypothetical protein